MRNLRANGVIQEAQARHLLARMAAAFPEACATGYEDLIASMRVHPKDRHVAAVAVLVGAQVIVTSNLKDFRDLPPGIEAKSPDDFLCDLLDLDPDGMISLLRGQAAALQKPPHTFEELLTALAKTVPAFAEEVRAYLRA